MEERFETGTVTRSSSSSGSTSSEGEEAGLHSSQSSEEESSQSSQDGEFDDDSDDDSFVQEDGVIVAPGGTTQQTDEFQCAVQQWTQDVVLGLGLCPWAVTAHRRRRLLYFTCPATRTCEVTANLLEQAQRLLRHQNDKQQDEAWWTLLFICPNVQVWNGNFAVFEEFVRTLSHSTGTTGTKTDSNLSIVDDAQVWEQISFVPFHPDFVRWYSLPGGIQKGSTVYAHAALPGYQKSPQRFQATVLQTQCPAFGRRKVQVQFPHLSKPQYIPTDWCYTTNHTTPSSGQRQPLYDNIMHQSPYPTIHLIRNDPDLKSLSLREVSRVKRRNAQHMMQLQGYGDS